METGQTRPEPIFVAEKSNWEFVRRQLANIQSATAAVISFNFLTLLARKERTYLPIKQSG
jgi:hypothetical protein